MNFRSIHATLFVCLCFLGQYLYAQNKVATDTLASLAYVDSIVIDRKATDYSFRVFTNLKTHQFSIHKGSNTVKYNPISNSGLGVGFVSKKMRVNIAMNVKTNENQPSARFNLQLNYKHKNHYFDNIFQRNKGYNLQREKGGSLGFRSDIVSVTNVLNYMYLFNQDNYRVGALRSAIKQKNKTGFSYGLGGFALATRQNGTEALFDPKYSLEQKNGGVKDVFGVGGGALGGFGGFFSMGHNLYSSLSINAGLGMMYKEKVDLKNEEVHGNPLLYQVSSSAVIGYVRKKYYINLSMDLGYHNRKIFNNMSLTNNITRAQFAIGYKFI